MKENPENDARVQAAFYMEAACSSGGNYRCYPGVPNDRGYGD